MCVRGVSSASREPWRASRFPTGVQMFIGGTGAGRGPLTSSLDRSSWQVGDFLRLFSVPGWRLGSFIRQVGSLIRELGGLIPELGGFIRELDGFIWKVGGFIRKVGGFVRKLGDFMRNLRGPTQAWFIDDGERSAARPKVPGRRTESSARSPGNAAGRGGSCATANQNASATKLPARSFSLRAEIAKEKRSSLHRNW